MTINWSKLVTDEERAAEFALVKQQAERRANDIIAQARRMFITDMPGQEMIYLRKEQEARAYLAANPAPETLENFPFMAREIGKTAPTAYEVAQIYLNMAAIWLIIGPELENARLSAKTTILSAVTREELDAALDDLSAQIAALMVF